MNLPKKTQRQFMIDLRDRLGADKDVVCQAYALAEKRGEVLRKGRSKSAEKYANDLWGDGKRNGWLKTDSD